MRPRAQVAKPDGMIGVNAAERSLEDWLLRADEASAEVAREARREHVHHVNSVLGGGTLSDKEITMPEDELASQVRLCFIP